MDRLQSLRQERGWSLARVQGVKVVAQGVELRSSDSPATGARCAAAVGRSPLAGSERPATPWLLAAAMVLGVLAVDPWGFAFAGPLRATLMAVLVLGAAATLGRTAVRLPRPVVAAWVALLASLLIGAVRTVDPLHAWIGTPDRRLGWLTWALFALAWLAGASLRDPRSALLVARAGAVAAACAGGYAVLELIGLAPPVGRFAGGRMGGLYAQPAYLGAACALLIPVAVGVALDTTSTVLGPRTQAVDRPCHRWSQPRLLRTAARPWWRGWRVVGVAGATLGGVALVGSQTRAAWVGLAAGALPLLRWAGPVRSGMRSRRAIALLVAGVLLLTAVVLVTPLGGRLLDSGDGARARIDEWRTGLAALADRPLSGYGPEGYRVAFPAVVDADYVRAHGRAVIPDRVHNALLDVGVTGGVPALAAYGALLALTAARAIRAVRDPRPWVVGCAVGVLAYLVQQLLLFPVIEVDPLWWILAGLVVMSPQSRPPDPAAVAEEGWERAAVRAKLLPWRNRASSEDRRVWLAAPVAVALALAAAATAAVGAVDVLADRELRRAVALTGPFEHGAALAAADRARQLRPDSIRAGFVSARVAARGGTIRDVDAALDRVEAGLAWSPRDPALRIEHAELLRERATRSRLAQDAERAVASLQALVADDPHHPLLRVRLAEALALTGDTESAAGHCAAAAALRGPGTSSPADACTEL